MSMILNAVTGANAAQAALDATSQNTANLQTPGYSRQSVVLGSVQPLYSGSHSAGSGVAVTSIKRFSDQYTNLQLWNAASELGQSTSGQPFLTQMEQVMGDKTTGISVGLDNFASALNAASVDPASNPLRQQVIASASSLAQQFNTQNQLMTQQLAAVGEQRTSIVKQVNELTTDIAKLNGQIADAQGTSVNAAGLMDARDQKIDSLASLVAVQVVGQPNGALSVALQSGQPLVSGTLAGTMTATYTATNTQALTLKFASASFTLVNTQLGGQLGGLESFQNNTLLPMMQSITSMAQQLTTTYNAQLAAGFTPAGTAGTPLFQYTTSGITGVLTVTPGIQSSDLAFSANAAAAGDSGNLTRLIALTNQPVTLPTLGTVSLSDAMTQIVGTLGTQSQQNQDEASTAQTVRDQAMATWQSVSGVSSNEEAANLVQYQQMYQANMTVIQVANTLFTSTLAMFNH